jgi:hypothetical protein
MGNNQTVGDSKYKREIVFQCHPNPKDLNDVRSLISLRDKSQVKAPPIYIWKSSGTVNNETAVNVRILSSSPTKEPQITPSSASSEADGTLMRAADGHTSEYLETKPDFIVLNPKDVHMYIEEEGKLHKNISRVLQADLSRVHFPQDRKSHRYHESEKDTIWFHTLHPFFLHPTDAKKSPHTNRYLLGYHKSSIHKLVIESTSHTSILSSSPYSFQYLVWVVTACPRYPMIVYPLYHDIAEDVAIQLQSYYNQTIVNNKQ